MEMAGYPHASFNEQRNYPILKCIDLRYNLIVIRVQIHPKWPQPSQCFLRAKISVHKKKYSQRNLFGDKHLPQHNHKTRGLTDMTGFYADYVSFRYLFGRVNN